MKREHSKDGFSIEKNKKKYWIKVHVYSAFPKISGIKILGNTLIPSSRDMNLNLFHRYPTSINFLDQKTSAVFQSIEKKLSSRCFLAVFVP